MKVVDRELWEVYGSGNYGSLTDVIYKNYETAQYPDQVDYQYLGIDFGYSFSPAAVLLVGRQNDRLYLKELVYEKHLTNSQLAARIKESGHGGLQMVADSAEPKSIADLRIAGLNVVPAIKGADSVRNGILAVRGFKLIADAGSVNLQRELRSYKWSDKKAGVPVKAYDHLLDCLRMIVLRHMKEGEQIGFAGIVSGTTAFQA